MQIESGDQHWLRRQKLSAVAKVLADKRAYSITLTVIMFVVPA